jgi:RNA polymerase sigma factor (sigma-70 family)
MTDDKAIVGAVLAGDREAFKTLVVNYQRLVSHVVFRMVTGDEDREDVCQEVFLRIFRGLESFKFESKLSTWIARIAYNASVNHLVRGKSIADSDQSDGELQACAEPGHSPEIRTERSDLRTRLNAEIEQLPAIYRVAVTLYHLEECKYEEIAEIMNMPIGTVKSHLFRARRMLKERLLSKYSREEIWG